MGLIDVYRINPADQFSVFSPSLKKTQEITYYTLLAKIRGDLNITGTSGNVDNWNEAYDQTIMSGVVTGYTTKTITLTRRDGTEISFDFQDLSPASEDTLDMVTTRGNSTVNIINVGGVSTPWLDLNTSYAGTTEVGRFSWNLDNSTADLGLNDNVVLKVGQDDMWYVRNESGSAIPRGTAVMAVGTVGASGRILVSPMVANGSVAAKYLLGITSEEIADDADGYVLAKGNLRDFNTSAYTAGQVLWCSPTTPGALTATEPAAPNLKLPIAFVVHADAEGMLAVRVTAGSTLSENNQVQFGTLANNDVLTYVSANGRWQNVPISTIASTLAFSTIAVTGQPSIVAETNQDTLNIASGTGISLTTNASTDTLTITNTAPDQIVSLTGTGTTTITGTYPNFTINSDDQYDGTVTSVALTAPSAFTVTGSPITTSGTLALGAAGTASQYIRGDGQLADFPTSGGGGSSVSYYLNGSINQGTFGGNTYYEFNKTPVIGAGTDFSISADGYIAQFITDANDPSLLEIPGGNWNVEFWFSASSSGGTPSFYVELSKYNGTTFTPIASSSGTPEFIAFGTTISQYYTALAVPQTTLAITDRLAIRVYVIHSGRTITLHTENSHLCQVITTFSNGLIALNGLTKQVQYFATGTSGTDFNISSVTDTHTFNLPTASSLNRGALSSADWTTFNSKADFSFKTIAVAGQSSIVADAADDTLTVVSGTGITLTTNSSTDTLTITNNAPDQTVVLTAGTGISTSGTYPNFTITNTAPDQVVSITAGTGMSVTGTYPSFTVTNTAPDQVVSITGAGTSVVTGTYPNFTITSNDQYVGTVTSVNLTAGTGITVSGGPIISSGSITVNNSDRGSSQNIFKNIAVPGQTTIVASTNNDTFTIKPGSGMSATTLGNDITLSNTDPGSSQNIFKNIAVVGQNTIVADSNNDTLSFVAGTGISLTTNDTTDSLTVTNSAPDQVVALSSGTGISVSGTYPNFTITNTSPSSGGTVTGTGTTNYVTKWTTSSNIGDSQIFDNGTNVGIGTTSPGAKLDVNNGANSEMRLTTSASGILQVGQFTNGAYIGTTSSNATAGILRLGTNSSERIRIDVNGNVGIGTTSPAALLYLNKQTGVTSFTSTTFLQQVISEPNGQGTEYVGLDFTGYNSGFSVRPLARIAMIPTGSGSVLSFGTSNSYATGITNQALTILHNANVGIGTTSPGYKLEVNGTGRFNGELTVVPSSTNGVTVSRAGGYASIYGSNDLLFETDGVFYFGVYTPRLFSVNSSFYTTAGGNVGIGTASPAGYAGRILDIGGASTVSLNFHTTTSGSTQNDGATLYYGSDNSLRIVNYESDGIVRIDTQDTERMRITSAGNVGIGTTAPTSKLSVFSDSATIPRIGRFVQSNSGTSSIGALQAVNAASTGSALDAGSWTQSSSDWIFRGYGNVSRAENGDVSGAGSVFKFGIRADGNVGIGTTSPATRLDIAGAHVGSIGLLRLNSSAGNISAQTYYIDGVYKAAVYASTDNNFYLWGRDGDMLFTTTTSNTERMRITSAGNVGIGTTSPASRLHVETSASNPFRMVRTGGSATNFGYEFGSGAIGLYDYTNSTYRYYITSGGNVGIGTTSPATRLHVDASGHAMVVSNDTGNRRIYFGTGGTGEPDIQATLSNGTARQLSINAAGGNVGIGTTTPTYKLQVVSSDTSNTFPSSASINVTNSESSAFGRTAGINFSVGNGGTPEIMSGVYGVYTSYNTSVGGALSFVTNTGSSSLSEKMRITSTGDVGIGTTSPSQKLDVNGYITSQRYYPYSSGSTYIAGDTAGVTIEGSGYFYVFPSAGSYFQGIARFRGGISNDTASYLQINGGSSNVTYFNGTVGIGTTAPSSILEIAGASPVLTINRTSGTSSTINFNSSGSNFASIISNPSNGENRFSIGPAAAWGGFHTFYTDTSERMRITAAGNVGIGTTTPNGRLQVDGDFYVNGIDRKIMNYSGAVDYGTLTNNSVRFNQNGAERARISTLGNFGIGTTSPAEKLEVNGNIKLSSTAGSTATPSNIWLGNDYSNGTTRDKLKIYLFNSGPEQYGFSVGASGDVQYHSNVFHDFYVNNGNVMRINSSGNVGIGTTTPGAKLDVIGNARATTLSTTSGLGLNVGAYAYLSQTISGVMTFLGHNVRASDSVANTAIVQNGGWISSLIKMYYNEGITFHTDTTVYAAGATYPLSTTERMRIQTNGNVGIGTSSPFSRLTVSGALSASTSQMSIVNTEGGHAIVRAGISGVSNNGISFVTANADGSSQNVRMVVSATGDVGIGTTSPAAALSIVRGAGAVAYIELAGNNNTIGTTSMLYGQDGGNNGYVWNRANAPIYFGTNNSTRMFLSAAGNLGIGTTSPSASLHVGSTGGVIFGATAGAVGTSQITTQNPVSPVSSRFAFGTDGTGWQYRIAKNTAGTIVDLVTVADSGNVGIGTTSPAYKLDVVGKIFSSTEIQSSAAVMNTSGGYASFGSNSGATPIRIGRDTTSNDIIINASGNVGIGTTSPGSKLTVIGDIATSTRVASDTINGYTGGSTPLTIQTGGAQNLIIGTNNTERIRVTTAGDVGIGTTSPSAKLHVIGNATVSATLSTAHAKITGTIADSFGLVGTAGQILSSTGTGIEWITGGGGGGGSTIIVKDEGTTIGSSFTTLDFVGNNIQASASGSTAVVTAYNNAGTGSIYANDTATQYAPTASFANVEINSSTIEASAPDTAGTTQKLIAIVTFGVDNVSDFDGFNNFDFRLYNFSGSTAVPDTTHSWCSYMSKGEFEKRTVFTFHIPLYDGVGGSDVIRVQAKQSTAYTPEIYYCALTLIEGTN